MNAIDILNCWDETLRTNNRNALGQHLAPDFAFQMLGQNAMELTLPLENVSLTGF